MAGSIFEKIHLKNTAARRVALSYLVAATAGDTPRSCSDAALVIRHAAKLAMHVKTFGHFFEAMTSSIDDRLDPMPYAEAVELGKIDGGNTPCPFILNPKVMTAEDWKSSQISMPSA